MAESKLEGLKETITFLQDTKKQLPNNISEFLYDIGTETSALASKNVPYDTGYLWSTIDYDVEDSGENKEVTIYADADYADEVEFGTSSRPASLFMTKAYDEISSDLESKFTKKVLDEI